MTPLKTFLPWLALLILVPTLAFASWVTDGNILTAAVNSQRAPRIVSDGGTGAITVWLDDRVDNGGWDLYSQRTSAFGATAWAANGAPVVVALNGQYGYNVIPDGNGGAFVTWVDDRPGGINDIYAQRINVSGTPAWAASGVGVCIQPLNQGEPVLAVDGAGGVFVAWSDRRAGGLYDIYAQHLDANGTALWTANGIALCTAVDSQFGTHIVADGSGGAIVLWEDTRSPTIGATDIYAQRVNAGGAAQWTVNGVALTLAAHGRVDLVVAPDGAGGAIAAWLNLSVGKIYAQRVSASGVPLWTSDGVLVSTAAFQSNPAIDTDLAGGAVLAWHDPRDGVHNTHAQRVDASGVLQWATDGIALCAHDSLQGNTVITNDGNGGAIVAWQDHRNGNADIFAQRVDAAGNAQWTTNGISVCSAPGDQMVPSITSNSSGGAVVAWDDARNGEADIAVYALSIGPDGSIPTPVRDTPVIPTSLSPNFPNPFAVATSMDLKLSERADVSVTIFDVTGRVVGSRRVGSLDRGVHQLVFAGFDDRGHPLPSGVYFYRVTAAGETITRKLVIAR